jgi:hypothetical protein
MPKHKTQEQRLQAREQKLCQWFLNRFEMLKNRHFSDLVIEVVDDEHEVHAVLSRLDLVFILYSDKTFGKTNTLEYNFVIEHNTADENNHRKILHSTQFIEKTEPIYLVHDQGYVDMKSHVYKNVDAHNISWAWHINEFVNALESARRAYTDAVKAASAKLNTGTR